MTTADVFLGGRLVLLQPATGFRAGLDAVLLAAAVEAKPGAAMSVLDAGAGVGTAGLCLASRVESARVTLVEMAPALTALARENVQRNRLGDRVRVIETDLRAPAAALAIAGLVDESFDHVIANPPYLDAQRHRLPDDPVAAGAFGMDCGGLEQWARFIVRMTKPGGGLTMIHRADALYAVLQALDGRFGHLRIVPIQPRVGAPAHRIVVDCRKGSRAPLQLMPSVILHGDGNGFTPEIDAVLRDGASLHWRSQS